MIAGLARELLAGPVVAIDAGGASLRGLLTAAGAAYALGTDLRTAALFGDRFARPFDLDRPLRFLENPCEQAPLPQHATGTPAAPPRGAAAPEPLHAPQPSRNGAAVDVLERVRRAVAERTELPLDTVLPAHRLIDDLHLNSISVGQMVAGVARDLGLAPSASPTEYADATVAEVARALEERLQRAIEQQSSGVRAGCGGQAHRHPASRDRGQARRECRAQRMIGRRKNRPIARARVGGRFRERRSRARRTRDREWRPSTTRWAGSGWPRTATAAGPRGTDPDRPSRGPAAAPFGTVR